MKGGPRRQRLLMNGFVINFIQTASNLMESKYVNRLTVCRWVCFVFSFGFRWWIFSHSQNWLRTLKVKIFTIKTLKLSYQDLFNLRTTLSLRCPEGNLPIAASELFSGGGGWVIQLYCRLSTGRPHRSYSWLCVRRVS